MSHPIRRVGMREHLMMVGNHHMSQGKRHWRSDAAAFAITDFHGSPLLWVEGLEVVGEMSLTIPKPQSATSPAANETLLWFEVVPVSGSPMIRTWWAQGKNAGRTQRVCRAELLDAKTWPERLRQLLQLMNWVS